MSAWRFSNQTFRLYGVQSCTTFTNSVGVKRDCGEASLAYVAALIRDVRPRCTAIGQAGAPPVIYTVCAAHVGQNTLDLGTMPDSWIAAMRANAGACRPPTSESSRADGALPRWSIEPPPEERRLRQRGYPIGERYGKPSTGRRIRHEGSFESDLACADCANGAPWPPSPRKSLPRQRSAGKRSLLIQAQTGDLGLHVTRRPHDSDRQRTSRRDRV